jgi:Protein of unknown function (DUF2490)
MRASAASKLWIVTQALLSWLIFSLVGNAQEDTPVNGAGWYGYQGNHPFIEGGPWGLFIEGTIKRNDVITDKLALSGRIGLNYELSSGHAITGGYAVQYNYPYDSASLPYNWMDNRIWEQFEWRRQFGNGKRHALSQRFRMEQRWLERKSAPDYDEVAGWQFQNTFRYRLKVNLGLNRIVSLSLYDEVHLRAPPPDASRILDQNVAYAGLVFNLDKRRRWRLETGYMNQWYWNSAETQEGLKRINHMLRVTIVLDAPLRSR